MATIRTGSRWGEIVGYAAAGVVLGALVDRVNIAVQNVLGFRHPIIRLLISIMIVAAVPIAISLTDVGMRYVSTWQFTIPGLFFATMFFNTQTMLMGSLQAATW